MINLNKKIRHFEPICRQAGPKNTRLTGRAGKQKRGSTKNYVHPDSSGRTKRKDHFSKVFFDYAKNQNDFSEFFCRKTSNRKIILILLKKKKHFKIGEALVSFKHKYYKLFPKYYWESHASDSHFGSRQVIRGLEIVFYECKT